jgi:hypothetical protein
MATDKLFTVAGTATQNGTTKVRFANDLVSRVKILTKNGCTNINLIELPRPMTKLEALRHLQEVGITEGDAGDAVSSKLSEKAKLVRVQASKTASTTAEAVSAPAADPVAV